MFATGRIFFFIYKHLLNYLKYSFIQLMLLLEMLPHFFVKNANARELKHLLKHTSPPSRSFPCAAVQLEPAAGAIYSEQQHCYIAMVMDPRLGLWEGLDFRVTADEVSGEISCK